MVLQIKHDEELNLAIFSPSGSLEAWAEIRKVLFAHDEDARQLGTEVGMLWPRAITALIDLDKTSTLRGVTFEPVGKAKEKIQIAQAERAAIRATQSAIPTQRSENEIRTLLKSKGFVRRELRDFQMDCTRHLLALRNGADFSVPGAGKTTVAMAVHCIFALPMTRLLVVAPKNAFAAWEEAVSDCFDEATGLRFAFERLVGSAKDIQAQLDSKEKLNFIISYDKLTRELSTIRAALAVRPFHMILDEAHRIKGGDQRQRGRAVLALATLPVRRDILTGTPAPNSVQDLVPQFDFLWPGQRLAVNATENAQSLRNLFVRTTKSRLGLKPARRHFLAIEMSDPQKAYYALLRHRAIHEELKISPANAADLRRARRCVMRLLQAVTNPILAVTQTFPFRVPEDDPCRNIYEAVVDEGDSPKLIKAVEMAFQFAAVDEKVVIWACFHANIDRLESMLRDLEPVAIHGGVGTGSQEDDDTREGRIRRFHDDPDCKVLIANPAAGSEGISLHKVCHKAIYLERTYNAAHYLQSLDRIHRLGLPTDAETDVYILQAIGSQRTGSIDYSVSRRLREKMETMELVLDDPDIRQIALDEEESENLIDDVELADIEDILRQLTKEEILADHEQS